MVLIGFSSFAPGFAPLLRQNVTILDTGKECLGSLLKRAKCLDMQR